MAIHKIKVGNEEHDLIASSLAAARTISLNGAVSGSASFDGSKDISITTSFEGTVENATKAAQDANGNVITDTYMTKVNPTGSGNVSIGRKSETTTGDKSIAIGENTTASAEQTVAIGTAASATNAYAVAIGPSATASGEQSTAIGTAPTASGKQSLALGVHTTAAGEYSTSMGCWTNSNGVAGTTLGNGSTVDANSWAAVSSGIVTIARGLGQHVFGSYNIPDTAVDNYSTPAEHLLIVGNGDVLSDNGAQSNAMTLDWDGNAWFSGDVYVGSTSGTNKDDGSIKLSKEGHDHNSSYYTKTQSSNNYYGTNKGALDADICYDGKLYMVSSGSNVPCGDNYGVVLGLPYRQLRGNTKPDFGAQIFLPNGDDETHANSMFYRTSLGDTWNEWQEVATKADIEASIGSGSSGGNATSADKLNTNAGNATNPVYFANGIPVATTYTLGTSVPSGAKFTDTTYSAGTGISISGTTINNSGVRSIATGSTNGTISVNTNGTSTDVAVKGLGTAAYTASSNYVAAVTSTNKAITRFNGTNGAVQNSKIIIEDTTNSRDQSKGQVIAIPTTGGKKMVYGLCTDQTDGTAFIGGLFSSSTTSYPYAEGLAIGGSSGNLLWKGAKVTTTDDTYAAGKITAGTFAGQVVANSSNQAVSTSLLRNSKLVSTDINPTVNGEICWTYK